MENIRIGGESKMSESIHMFVVFCITIITIIGIVSAIMCFSRDPVKFSIKAKTKLPDQTETEFDIDLLKQAKKENR